MNSHWNYFLRWKLADIKLFKNVDSKMWTIHLSLLIYGQMIPRSRRKYKGGASTWPICEWWGREMGLSICVILGMPVFNSNRITLWRHFFKSVSLFVFGWKRWMSPRTCWTLGNESVHKRVVLYLRYFGLPPISVCFALYDDCIEAQTFHI